MGESAPTRGPGFRSRGAARVVALAALLLLGAGASAQGPGQERALVKFGYVAHDAGMDRMFEGLIEEWNRSLEEGERRPGTGPTRDLFDARPQALAEEEKRDTAPTRVRFGVRPRALAYADLAKLESLGIDVAYLTPLVHAEIQAWEERPFAPIAGIETLPELVLGEGEARLPSEYAWTVLVDPTAVDWTDLGNRRRGIELQWTPKPRFGWLPLSTSGHLFPLHSMVVDHGIPRGEGRFLPDRFEAVEVRSTTHMLDLFFAPSEPVRIDIAPMTVRGLYRYLAAGGDDAKGRERRNAARAWLRRIKAPELPRDAQAAEVARAVANAGTWTGAKGTIHNPVLVCRRDLRAPWRERVTKAILDSGTRLRRAFSDRRTAELLRKPRVEGEYAPEIQKELRERLQMAGCPGLSRTLLRDLDAQDIHGLGPPPSAEALRKVSERLDWYSREGFHPTYIRPGVTVGAEEMVRDIARDIGRQRALEGLRGEPYEPRVALVLAGGGASGAFQAGAIEALLGAIRAHNADYEVLRGALDRVEIRIVAGTSVGALNGVVAAAGGAFDPARAHSRDAVLRELWTGIDASRVLSTTAERSDWDFELTSWRTFGGDPTLWLLLALPVVLAAIAFGLAFAAAILSGMRRSDQLWLLALASLPAVLLLVQKRSVASFALAGSIAACILMVRVHLHLGWCLIVFAGFLLGISAGLLDAASGTFAGAMSVGPTLALGVVCAILGFAERAWPGFWKKDFQVYLSNLGLKERDSRGRMLIPIGLLLLAVVPLWFLDILSGREAVFQNWRLEETLGRAITSACGGAGAGIDADRIRELASRAPPGGIDVVVTATDLMEAGGGRIRPREVYLHWGASRTPDADGIPPHWVDLRRHPGNLVGALLASAAIFPGLPPVIFPKEGGTLRLIDGGYLNNVPTGAALALGATHLIVLQFERPYAGRDPASAPRPRGTWETGSDLAKMLLERAQGSSVETVGDRRTWVLSPSARWIPTAGFDGGKKPDGSTATFREFLDLGAMEARKKVLENGNEVDAEEGIGFLLYRP